jgi:hypothetical protein
MPTLTRWLLRSGLCCLLLGLCLGVVPPAAAASVPWLANAWPVQLHLLTVGWLTQLIFGVAWWLFPRAAGGPSPLSIMAGWAAFWCLQAGLGLRVIFEPLRAADGWTGFAAFLLRASALLLFLSAAGFAAALWPRIRER